MSRRIPWIATVLVLAAAAVMVALGLWQLRRAGEKDAVLSRYEAAQARPAIAFPATPVATDQAPLFRRSTGTCMRVSGKRTGAGRNRADETGYVHIADCASGPEGAAMAVEMGWSRNPNAEVAWNGGTVSGVIAPDSRKGIRLVSDQGLGGLEPSAPPSIDSIPNNHLSYAVQWFLFAGIALLIYALALRQRMAREPNG